MVTIKGSNNVLEKSNVGFDFCRNNKLNFLVYEEQDDLLKKTAENLLMIEEIKEAITNDRIEPFYQPIIDNRTESIVKYESLTRIMIRKTFETFKESSCEFSINIIYDDIICTETITLIE